MEFGVGSSVGGTQVGKLNAAEKDITALIVDDDQLIRRISTVLVSKFGFKTVSVENGKKAVDLYDSGASFNLIVMDMEMPIMNGIQATKRLREMGVKCKIIGVTANTVESEKQKFIDAGLDYCFQKPLTADKLAYTIKN